MSAVRPRIVRIIAAGAGAALVLAAASGSLRPVPASAAPVATVTVTTTNDIVDGNVSNVANLIGSPGADGSISLREAIEAANTTSGPVEIDVPAGIYTLTTVAGGSLSVGTVTGSNITISGAGAGSTTIAGDGTDRVLSLDPNLVGNITVAISGVTISGGHDQDGLGGAGIIGGNPSPADTTTLNDCAITNNTTTTTSSTHSPGGGIQYLGGSLSIASCTISGNSSGSSPGGGVDYETLSPHIGTFSLTNSTVSGNTLTNTDAAALVGGAGVHVQAETGSTVTISGDTFTGNVATGSSTGPVGGGALWLEGGATVTRSTFTGNQANGPAGTLAGGGAISFEIGSTTVSFSRIVGNTATHGPSGVLNDRVQAVTTATDDWWGCNAGPNGTGCDATSNSGSGTGSLTTSPWLTLTTTASSTRLLAGQTSTVTASLTHDSNSTDTSGSGHVPDGIAVGFATTDALGEVSPTGGQLSSGTAATTYTAGVSTGSSGATATVDNQSVTTAIGIGTAPAITSVNNATFEAEVSNTFTVTATGTPSPTFSESGALPAGITFNTTTGVLSGTFPQIAAPATYPITITASNGYGSDATQGFTLTLIPYTQAPSITSADHTSFTEGVAGTTFTVTTTGTPTPVLTEDPGDILPSGVTVDAATGLISGTPPQGSNGTYTLHFTASNLIGSDAHQTFTLTVGLPPAITSASGATFTVGTAGSFAVTATGFPSPFIALGGSLPAGLGFDTSTGILSGTPAAHTGGTYTLTFTASNGFGSDSVQSFTLTVDEAPSFTSADHTTFTAGTPGAFGVTATGFPLPTLSAGAGLPAGVSFTAGTGTVAGTPAALTGGVHTVTLTASNGIGGDATQTFTLTVDEAPSFTSANGATFTVGTHGSLALTANGYPAPTFSGAGALPSGVTLSGGVLSGTPAGGSGGSYPLTLTATNGVGSDDHQAFTLTVDERAAITSADHTTFTVGAAGSFTVTATGTPAPALALGDGAVLPPGVTFDSSTGTLAGTPSAHSGTTYSFDIVAHNGIGADAVQHFTLAVDEAPAFASASSDTFVVGAAGTFTVTAGGFPTPTLSEDPGDTLPAGVTFDATTGVLSGTPAPAAAGDHTLHFTASNAVGPDATQTFTLHVDELPAITSAASTTFTVGSAGSASVTVTGFPAPVLTEDPADALPSGVGFDAATGTLSGTPDVGSGGVYTLHFTASNGVSPDAIQTFTLTVDEGPAFTSPSSTTFTTGVAGTTTISASGEPSPSITEDPGDTLPGGISFDPVHDVLAGTPADGTGGTFTLHFTASNLIGGDAHQTLTLTVDQPAQFTTPNAATFVAGSAGSFTVTASGFPQPTLGESNNDTLPDGVSFDPATGVLSGNPSAGTGGTYTLDFTAHNGAGADATQTFTLTVDEAPALTGPAGTTFTTLSPGVFSVTATGYPIPTLSLTGDPLPAGVTFDPVSGLLSGSAADGTAGDYALVVTAANGIGSDAVQDFDLTVKNATTTTLTTSTAHAVVHQAVTLTATVAAHTGTPTGPVLFMEGSTTLGSGTLAVSGGVDRASYTTAPGDLAAGSHSISAVYAGDALDTVSDSSPVGVAVTTVTTVTVTPHSHTLRATGATHTPVAVVVTDADGRPVAGDSVTLSVAPGGRVSFSPGTVTTDASGTASTDMQSSTTAGAVTVTATEGFGGVAGTATEKLLGTRFKTAALSLTRIPADGTSTTTASVLVVDGSGAPVAGEPVTFSTEGHPGDAGLAHPSVITDSSGVASDSVTSSTTAGIQAITAGDDNSDSGDDFASVLALTQLPPAGPNAGSFIHNAYVTLLGRDAGPAEVAYWQNLLDHGTPRSVVAEALASSSEYRSDVIGGTSTVPGFYAQYLGRPSDPVGVASWLGVMAAGGGFEQVRLGFLDSPEYRERHANDPSTVIDALYEDVLGRPSDPTGKAYWLAHYDVATIATQFIHSPEGRAHLVTVLYAAILDRAPDSAGLAFWTQQLLGGASDEFIIGALLGSDEYYLGH